MNNIKEVDRAIDYLEEHWKKGHKERGNAMVLFALAQMGGRAEQKIIMENINGQK